MSIVVVVYAASLSLLLQGVSHNFCFVAAALVITILLLIANLFMLWKVSRGDPLRCCTVTLFSVFSFEFALVCRFYPAATDARNTNAVKNLPVLLRTD